MLVPDRDSAKKDKDGKPLGLGVPVIRVLDAKTGKWVKNIPLVHPQAADKSQGRGSPHQVQVMRRYIYASQWQDGYIYCISPETLEVVRRLGPVDMAEGNQPLDRTATDAFTRQEAREPPQGVAAASSTSRLIRRNGTSTWSRSRPSASGSSTFRAAGSWASCRCPNRPRVRSGRCAR